MHRIRGYRRAGVLDIFTKQLQKGTPYTLTLRVERDTLNYLDIVILNIRFRGYGKVFTLATVEQPDQQNFRIRSHGKSGLMLMTALSLLVFSVVMYAQDYEGEPINYQKSQPHDAITDLQSKIDRGEVHLKYEGRSGYLLSVLQALHVSVSSQMLVFSKTSFQRDLISPQRPRALYFNDRVYVGWVQGGDYVELSSVDPQLGTVFYLLPQQVTTQPKFVRRTDECLQCHDSGQADGVPGNLMRSVYPAGDGNPILPAGTYTTSDESPLSERWGGWYVTGTHGLQRHMGNMVFHNEATADKSDLSQGANVTNLDKLIDTTPYLSRHSDIVALMVAEHQTQTQNLITRANYGTRQALLYERQLNKDLNRPADYRSDSVTSRINGVCERLLKGILFVGEAKLTAPIAGTSGFAERFATYGPRDSKGRSLRDFDLHHRLFKYPCSYQIYSAAFDGLPDEAKSRVYQRLEEVLTGKETSPDYSHLSPSDRKAILEILRDTKQDFVAWERTQT